MNETESDFEQLRKLLAAKKHETPPPGYFNHFSSGVISQIRINESSKRADGLLGTLFSEAPWLLRIVRVFEAKPAYAGVFASALCLLLVAGIVYTEPHSDATADNLAPAQTAQANPGGASLAAVSANFLDQSAPSADMVSSTNPVMSLQPVGSSFPAQNPLFQTVDFNTTSH